MTRQLAPIPETANHLLFNLEAMTSAEARRQWRAAIKSAWNNHCAYCSKPPIDSRSLTIDHVKPRAFGGEERTSNCIPACRECNQAKGSTMWLEWYRLQPFYSLEAEMRIKQWLATGTVDVDVFLDQVAA
jgi:hypothetical protein